MSQIYAHLKIILARPHCFRFAFGRFNGCFNSDIQRYEYKMVIIPESGLASLAIFIKNIFAIVDLYGYCFFRHRNATVIFECRRGNGSTLLRIILMRDQ